MLQDAPAHANAAVLVPGIVCRSLARAEAAVHLPGFLVLLARKKVAVQHASQHALRFFTEGCSGGGKLGAPHVQLHDRHVCKLSAERLRIPSNSVNSQLQTPCTSLSDPMLACLEAKYQLMGLAETACAWSLQLGCQPF